MLGNLPISASAIHSMTSNGSPMLIKAVGRAFGLADAEQSALVSGKIPTWFWVAIFATAGVVAGVQIHKRWPNKIPKAFGG
jgi:hypothetical protein